MDTKSEISEKEFRTAKLEAILNTAVAAIVTIDREGVIDSINPATSELFGYLASELIGHNVKILMPGPFAEEHDGYLAAYLRSGVKKIIGIGREVTGRRKDGSTFPLHLAVSEFEANGARHFAGVITDLTARKRIEDSLRIAQDRLQETLDLSGIALWRWNRETGRIIEFESPYARMLGLASQAKTLDTPSFLAMVHPEDRELVAAAISAAREGQAYLVEYRVVLPDGAERWLLDKGWFLSADSAGQELMLGATIDLTSQRIAEQALEVSERKLFEAQKLEAIGQLAGGIAHDFNNLLTVILGNQELLAMRLTDEKDLALLKRSQDATEMGARLTERLLTFARRRQLEPSKINLNAQISEMIELLRRSIGEDITLTTNLAPQLASVRTDASEVENAILNLVINARDAMPNGGTITIETDEHSVDDDNADSRLPRGDYVRLSVTDTGVGMPPKVLSRAFEPFFTTKQSGRGTGLGLSTVHGFVQQSGGLVTAYSEVGRGTIVNIYLPRLDEGPPDEAPVGFSLSVPTGSGQTILLVEDNPDVRDVARKRLDDLGYSVIEAETGPDAIEMLKARASEIDAVFSDVVMPGGLSGYDVAHWVLANAPSVKVLLTSGYPDEVARAKAAPLPSVRLLRKPYGRAEFARAIWQLLGS